MTGIPVVKGEMTDALALEEAVISLCASNPKGINDKILETAFANVDVHQRVAAINRLLTMGKIEVLKNSSGLVYRLKNTSALSNLKGVDNQEKLVYQTIESAGNKGIWSKDIRYKCNLMTVEVNRILKTLQSKKLIKSVQSVTALKKKVYMLFNLTPDLSVTGGAWYSDQDFESEFVEVLNQQCFKYLQQKAESAEKDIGLSPVARNAASYCSSKDVLDFISKLGVSKVELTTDDIETILDTLIYDGKIDVTVVPTATGESCKHYRAIKPLTDPTPFTRTPCSLCPVFDRCSPGGQVSPETCIYLNDWLEY